MTEYLYDRDNPKSHFRQRISGIQGLFYGVPNINERADMIGRYLYINEILTIYRSLAKETDGDFGKFVTTTRKPRDMAQKWRAFKNIARFAKNPYGYAFWKINPLHRENRIRFVYLLLFWHLYQSFLLYIMIKNSKEASLIYYYREGKND